MTFILSIIEEPVGDAAFGRADVERLPLDRHTARNRVYKHLYELDPNAPQTPDEGRVWKHDKTAWAFAERMLTAQPGEELTEPRTGLTFRLDDPENAPHACPCGRLRDQEEGTNVRCGRLVLPGDHAYAEDPDAYCTGCWGDTINPGCLPKGTAHPVKEA